MLPDRPLPGAVHGQPGHVCTWGCPDNPLLRDALSRMAEEPPDPLANVRAAVEWGRRHYGFRPWGTFPAGYDTSGLPADAVIIDGPKSPAAMHVNWVGGSADSENVRAAFGPAYQWVAPLGVPWWRRVLAGPRWWRRMMLRWGTRNWVQLGATDDDDSPLGCPDDCPCGPCQDGDCGGCVLEESPDG